MRYPSFWGVFRGGQAFFDPFEVKINVYDATMRPNFSQEGNKVIK